MKVGCIMIFTTTVDRAVAEKIASILVEMKLAACVHMDEIESFYEWKGKIERSPEFRLIIKASSDNYESIEKTIIQNHNYELPGIVAIEADRGLPAYLKWIKGKE